MLAFGSSDGRFARWLTTTLAVLALVGPAATQSRAQSDHHGADPEHLAAAVQRADEIMSNYTASDDPLEQAYQAMQQGDNLTAYKLAGKVLAKNSDDRDALFLAGTAGLRVTDRPKIVERGQRYLERLLELEPEIPGVHYLLGSHAFEAAGTATHSWYAEPRYLEAAWHFEQELGLPASPRFAEAFEGRALSLRFAERTDEAITAHEQWIEAFPADPAPYVSLASLLADEDRLEEALALMERDGGFPRDVTLSLGFTLGTQVSKRNQVDELEAMAERLRVIDDDAWQTLGLDALSHWHHDRWDAGRDAIQALIVAGPPPPDSVIAVVVESIPISVQDRLVNYWLARLRDPEDDPMPEGCTKPRRIEESYVRPFYPEAARTARLGASVLLLCVLGKDGVPRVVTAFSSRPRFGFEQSALAALRQWRYEPSTKNGEPVETFFTVSVDYTIQ